MAKYKLNAKSRRFRQLNWLLPAILILVGVYMLALVFSPRLASTPLAPLVGVHSVSTKANPKDKQDYIIIPKINLKVAVVTGANEAALLKGAWHRYPSRGDPVRGGNFILAAHRFLMGWTPQQTRAKSPFYNIDKLAVGDPIVIIFRGQTYNYKITKSYRVKPTEVSIEDPGGPARLTLYSCTLKGSADGRSVLLATLQK